MSLPHQCRCAICGAIGVITPALINPFGLDPIKSGDNAYASSRADELASGDPKPYPYDDIAAPLSSSAAPTCVHGYTRCMPCKFPAE